ncbi:MAG: threonine synthase [Thermoanaerobaculia bacterium]
MTTSWLQCIGCGRQFDIAEIRYTCDCGNLLSVERTAGWSRLIDRATFDARLGDRRPESQSGVWRFREAVMDVDVRDIVTHPEGGTHLYAREALSRWAGVEQTFFKHEGENPTGSFKDRGMTVGMTQAKRVGARAVACASTGNTSASLAAYAAQAGMKSVVFIPEGKVALGKLAQSLAYGATVLQIKGDFDAAMKLVSDAASQLGIYLLNSINPFRIEGQKTIVWEMLQDLAWDAPDWIFVPAGNLGNTSAFGKAIREAHEAGWIAKVPRIAAIQATGANPFYRSFAEGFAKRYSVTAETVATAIRIGNPVSYDKARASIEHTKGVVDQVTDEELLAAKREIDRAGIGCEPASACSLAGLRKLRERGVVKPSDRVVCVLTGNVLKDPDIIVKSAGAEIRQIEATVEAVAREV